MAMEAMEFSDGVIASALVGAVSALIGYLLNKRDEAQGREIKEIKENHTREIKELKDTLEREKTVLWDAHNKDADRLTELERHVDKHHYVKDEIDDKLTSIERVIKSGLDTVVSEIKGLTSAFIGHAAREDAREEARLEVERLRAARGRKEDRSDG